MCEGLSTINGPIPPHPMFLKETHLDLSSARSNNSLCQGPSKLSGPIVSHLGLENENEKKFTKDVDYNVNPRVRENGKLNFFSHKNGNGVALLIELQGRAINPVSFKIREAPKNHIVDNTHKIKELMRKVKERETQKKREFDDKNTPVKALWKSDKYKEVQSKVKELLQQEPLAPRDPNKNFLRAHSRTGSISRPQSARPASSSDNKQLNLKSIESKDDIDFIRINQKFAKEFKMKRAPSIEMLKQVQTKLDEDLEKYHSKVQGKVPNYLEKRKEEVRKDQENYLKNLPDPDQPPGHRKLPEEERQKTLQLLQDAQNKLIGDLNTLPIRTDTLKLKNTKNDIEKKLAELDEAIKLFSKPKVFVKIDG